MSNDGPSIEDMDLSHIHLAVQLNGIHFEKLKISFDLKGYRN